MTLRPMTADTIGTCDWGGCDDDTAAERLSPQTGTWLAVCDRHVGAERRPSPGRATCPHCGTEYTLRVDGTFRLHNRGFAERCPGSGAVSPATATP